MFLSPHGQSEGQSGGQCSCHPMGSLRDRVEVSVLGQRAGTGQRSCHPMGSLRDRVEVSVLVTPRAI